MYSKKLTLGQVDCVTEYNGKLSVIDYKTSNKFKQRVGTSYFMQCTISTAMYEEALIIYRTNCCRYYVKMAM